MYNVAAELTASIRDSADHLPEVKIESLICAISKFETHKRAG